MNKDTCEYCNESKLDYATLYCGGRKEERERLARGIYGLILPEFQYWFTSNSKKQKGISAKKIGKNNNILRYRGIYKLICFPHADISVTRRNDVTHVKTTISDIKIGIKDIKKFLGIDLNIELGLKYKISKNESIKTILTDYGNGFYFTGLTNANSRGGLKPEVGFFIEDIYDEPIEKDKVMTYEENMQEESDYQVFISTINRENTDRLGNYLMYDDDLELEHDVTLFNSFEINNKIIFKKKIIKRIIKKQFVRTEFSNPYDNSHWTYQNSLEFIPYNSNTIKKLQNDIIIMYEDKENFVLRAPLTINKSVPKDYYHDLDLEKEKDPEMYNLLRFGMEYNSFKDYKYLYRQDMEYCKRWDRDSLEYKEFDSYGIGMDLGAKTGDQTTYILFGLKISNGGLRINEVIPITQILYDKRKHKLLNSVQRFNMLTSLIEEVFEKYPKSKYNEYESNLNQVVINIAIPQDGDWIEGMLETWINDKSYWNINLIKATTHGKSWGIIPRQDKICCLISSNYFKMNEEDVPYLWEDLWKCIKDNKTGKRVETPNSVNSLNALESFISIIENWIPADWLEQYRLNEL